MVAAASVVDLQSVEGIHRLTDPFPQPMFRGVGATLNHFVGQFALIGLEGRKDVIHGLPGSTDADSEPVELVGTE